MGLLCLYGQIDSYSDTCSEKRINASTGDRHKGKEYELLRMQANKRIKNVELRGCILKPVGNVNKRVK